MPNLIKPTHKALQHYYDALAAYSDQHVSHEGALRTAFQNLLDQTARSHGWILIPELAAPRVPGVQSARRVAGVESASPQPPPRKVRPDATLRDSNSLPRGYWEAKDTFDDLDAEIAKKAARGYPLTNTIFEDTRHAVLYQGKREVLRIDLTDRRQLADLLNQFYTYTEPDIAEFDQAVEEFRERVPELARGLAEKIAHAHTDNPRFIAAFDDFFALCQTALHPNISRAAVDEMLVQHLLTERLIRAARGPDRMSS